MIFIFRNIVILGVLCFLLPNLFSQEIITTSGGEGSGTAGTVNYTVGQVSYTTIVSDDGTVTQGVQQPFEIFVEVGIEEAEDIVLFCSAFPNPTTGKLTLRIENYDHTNLIYQLYDFNGRIITNNNIDNTEVSIDMTNLKAATYFLKVTDGKKEIKVFKIIKN